MLRLLILLSVIESSDIIAAVNGAKSITEKFEFTRIEPANELGITTKVIAHIHRPANTHTDTWRFNRDFTPVEVLVKLHAVCGEDLNENKLKWNNCQLDDEGLTADLSHGIPQSKNKTITYLEVSYRPFIRIVKEKRQVCILTIVEENPVYFLIETFSKLLSNDSLAEISQHAVVHQHQLGRFGQEFLSIYGNSIDQDGIYNFDHDDYEERNAPYECFLSIGSSQSVSVIEEKCPITCEHEAESTGHSSDSTMKISHYKGDFHNEL